MNAYDFKIGDRVERINFCNGGLVPVGTQGTVVGYHNHDEMLAVEIVGKDITFTDTWFPDNAVIVKTATKAPEKMTLMELLDVLDTYQEQNPDCDISLSISYHPSN